LEIIRGHATDLIDAFERHPDLIVTDPPYAFGGEAQETELSAAVAVVLRESAKKLKRNSFMVILCASSWRSINYMVEATRGIAHHPVRIGTWVKPNSRSKVTTSGWKWASVAAVVFKKGKPQAPSTETLDWIESPIVLKGRSMQLPEQVAEWAVKPFAIPGGLLLDPFAGSGAILHAGDKFGMDSVGFEIQEK
jgi:DNA modification methylase